MLSALVAISILVWPGHGGCQGRDYMRRKWRSERRHLPTKAVALAGGWTDVATIERCYDMPDEAHLLAVTSETNKRREQLPHGLAAN